MSRDIIIQYIPQEIRVAIRENSRLVDLFFERPNFRNPVGNIYKGRIIKVMPGMGSAFVNIGLFKAAFLNIDDLVYNHLDGEQIEAETTGDAVKTKPLIENILTEGQEIIVQVSKAPISTKGARISSFISLPGRNVVVLPGSSTISFSRQITDDKEKSRLGRFLQRYRDSGFGIIVRTFGQGASESTLRDEIDYLVKIWSEVEEKAKVKKAPTILFEEPNIILKLVRDSLNHEIDNIIIDDEDEYNKLKHYLDSYMPDFASKLTLYKSAQNIFDAYGMTDDMQILMERKVPLASGGGLVIDQSEALTSIDVNTGRFLGDVSHEETVLQTNIEAAQEIVHQVKLRNIGGIIIIDFIDMDKNAHRQQVFNTFKLALKKDKARSQVSPISDMGLIEMTRQRTQENINKILSSPCICCDGTGMVLSNSTTFFAICRDLIQIKRHKKLPKSLVVFSHPDIVDYAEFQDRESLSMLKRTLGVKIKMVANHNFHPNQYKIGAESMVL